MRTTVAVGSTILLRRRYSATVARDGQDETQALNEVQKALEHLRKEAAIVERYLDTSLDPWPNDYLSMEPAEDASEASPDAMALLREYMQIGEIRDMESVKHQVDGRWLVMIALDVQGAGFVCGLGLAASAEVGEQLAAKQAVERLVVPKDRIAYILQCADSVRDHEHHSGARPPATQAAEALDGLSTRLRDVHAASFCPCGKAWMAVISARVFHGTLVLASSADWQEGTAMALAGETFISRLRWYLRVPPDEPHAPAEWSRTWQQRAAAKDPWGGVHRRVSGELLRLAQLGSGAEDVRQLEGMLGEESGRYERNAALQAAIQLRSRATPSTAPVWQSGVARASGWEEEEQDVPAKPPAEPRPYEVTPAEDDPRRSDLIGKLPVEDIREDLGAKLEHSQVVVVSGGTGSGKSTQLPQFILDDWRGEAIEPQRIVVTQPRRIAAISVAERVAWERREKLGEGVGYSVHGSTVRPKSPEGSIEFVTVGTLLRRAISDPLLQNVHTIVVDEVHERDLLTDFLLILLREVLPQRPSLRLVLMSATVDVETFTAYFEGCPVLEVPPGSVFPVKEVHLDDDYFETFGHREALLQAEIDDRSNAEETRDQVSAVPWGGGEDADEAILEMLESVIRAEASTLLEESEQLSILCFLPGWAEIRRLNEALQSGKDAGNMWVLPLHSILPKDDQQKVFQHAPKGRVKVILGTNIAESSVTIDDVAVVVDAGLQRELTYDARRRLSTLSTVRISRSNAIQRCGRAGRVRDGRVIRFYSREHLEAAPLRPAPEMQRCDLAQSCLQAAALGRDPRGFLAQAPDPPTDSAVEVAMEELMAIDALEEGQPPRLLPVGEVIARLPLEPLLGRAAMFGCLLGLPSQTATVLAVAGASTSPFFQAHGSEQSDRQKKMKEFSDWSDVFAAARALLEWEGRRKKDGDAKADKWATANSLNPARLATFSRDKAQLLRDMDRAGLRSATTRGAQQGKELQQAAFNDDSANIVEKREEMTGAMELDTPGEATSIAAEDRIESGMEPLLTSVLCLAYPTHLARRLSLASGKCKAQSGSALISPGSVNGVLRQGQAEAGKRDPKEPKTWLLYGEMQKSDQKQAMMQGTTRINDWQVPLFCGLRVKDILSETDPVVELDNWVGVKGNDRGSTAVLRSLRRELQDTLSWQALLALGQGSAVASQYLERGSVLLLASLGLLTGDRQDNAAAKFLSKWEAPPLQALEDAFKINFGDEHSPADAPGTPMAVSPRPRSSSKAVAKAKAAVKRPTGSPQQRGAASAAAAAKVTTASVEEFTRDDLNSKTVVELKNILRSNRLKVSGKKAEMIERIMVAQQG